MRRGNEVYEKWLEVRNVSRVAKELSMCRETVRRILDQVAPAARKLKNAPKTNALTIQHSILIKLPKREDKNKQNTIGVVMRLSAKQRAKRRELITKNTDVIANSLIDCAKHIASKPPRMYWIFRGKKNLPVKCTDAVDQYNWVDCSEKDLVRLSLLLDGPNYDQLVYVETPNKRWRVARVARIDSDAGKDYPLAPIPSAYLELGQRLKTKNTRGEELMDWEKSLLAGIPTKPLKEILKTQLEKLANSCDDTIRNNIEVADARWDYSNDEG